jgi:hypothetical protein
MDRTDTQQANHGADTYVGRLLSTTLSKRHLNTATPIGWMIHGLHRNLFRSDRDQLMSRTSRSAPKPAMPVQNHPSCPTRPGAHQNQIHNTKEQQQRQASPSVALRHDQPPRALGGIPVRPIEDQPMKPKR